MDTIELSDFPVQAIVGILDREHRAPQTVLLDVTMGVDLRPSAGGDLSRSVDYASVADQLTRLLVWGQWALIESFVSAGSRLILAPPLPGEARAQVEQVTLRVRKPDVLRGVATPGVSVQRTAGETLEDRSWGDGVRAEVLQETPLTGAYRVALQPGARFAVPLLAAAAPIAGIARVDGERLTTEVPRGSGATITADGPVVLLVVSRPPIA